MKSNQKITQTVFEVTDELNPLLPEAQQLEKNLDTFLIGKSAKLDSLGLIMLIEAIEKKFYESQCFKISLPYEKVVQRNSPFQTFETLIDYISQNIEEYES